MEFKQRSDSMNDIRLQSITLNPDLLGIAKQAQRKAVGVLLTSAIFNL